MIFLLFFLIFSSDNHSPIQAFDILPGVNDLESGYNAVKMLSASEQRSQFRIFDLTDQSQKIFTVKTNGKQTKYTVPIFVQPTDISTRKEDNCESVAYTFEEFYRRY